MGDLPWHYYGSIIIHNPESGKRGVQQAHKGNTVEWKREFSTLEYKKECITRSLFPCLNFFSFPNGNPRKG